MSASALDRIVRFERAALTYDEFGSVESWEPYGDQCWALRQDVKDSEKWAAGQVQARISTRFHVRSNEFTRTITARDRIICEGTTFNVVGVKQVHPGRRQLIEMTTVAYV